MKKFILQQNSMTLHLEDDFEDILQLCKDKIFLVLLHQMIK